MALTLAQAKEKASQIKLAFFDIDGTLLDSRGQILPVLKTQIARIKNLGIKTAIASGRPFFAAKFLVDELGISGAGSFYTGAHLFDPLSRQTLAEKTLLRADVLALLARARELRLYREVYSPEAYYLESHTPVSRVHAEHLRVQPQIGKLEDIINQTTINKLLLGVNRAEQGELIDLLEAEFPQLIFARAYLAAYPDWQFASVISAEATKAAAFAHLCEHHSVQAHQVIAFGDAESDSDFLQMAGIGVAMGNAPAKVKAIADWVTGTADEAGVAQALDLFF